MKFITFSDKDTEYCYNASSIQRISWEEGSSVIHIDIHDKSYTHIFADDYSAKFTYYNHILRQLKGE